MVELSIKNKRGILKKGKSTMGSVCLLNQSLLWTGMGGGLGGL